MSDYMSSAVIFSFFFQAEDGIRDLYVTGVQTCALPIFVALVLLGQVLELRARSQTSSAIKSLLKLAPKTARIVRADGTEEDIEIRSEERRVGKECRGRWWGSHGKKREVKLCDCVSYV